MVRIDALFEQVQEVLSAYPQLEKKEDEKGYIIYGKFVLNSEFEEIPLYDEYTIEVLVPFSFPIDIPHVRETEDSLDKDFEHWYSDGELCLGAICDLVDFINRNPRLIDFFSGPITSYFYSASYFKRYKAVPYGERSHGILGTIEAYLERYGAKDIELLIKLLGYIAGFIPYRGHIACPCGSGKVLRKCHGELVLKDISSTRAGMYKADALMIICWYFEEKKKKGQYGRG